MKAIGLDIGTTTISGVLVDVETGELLNVQTVFNNSEIKGINESEKLQNPDIILKTCERILDMYTREYSDIISVGVTGQMHGILYVDQEGKAVSPLYTWQDQSGAEFVDELTQITGYPMAVGYGLSTYYSHMKTRKIPENAVSFCTIPDYVVMSLTGEKKVLMHQSMAGSLGMYNLKEKGFDQLAVEKAGIRVSMLPEITTKEVVCGKTKENLLVSVALGDNQSSFLGSVDRGSRVLVNVGTGAQISVYSEEIIERDEVECRPYLGESYLLVGSALCGGYAYSLMKRFLDEVLVMTGTECTKDLYNIMNEIAQKAYEQGGNLKVDTRFRGTRKQPELKGGIKGLTEDTFHPENLILGVLEGICEELYGYYNELPENQKKGKFFVGSGNGIRKNLLLQKICCDRFGMNLKIPQYSEEAAYGAAVFSLLACGKYESLDELQNYIKVESRTFV